MTTTADYRWDPATRPLPFRASKPAPKAVTGEIKPHNRAGIAAGVDSAGLGEALAR